MIIGTCGYGSTGSSAISDYLSEYPDIQVIDGLEFAWVYEPDGLVDLEYHLMNPHNQTEDSILAIERYLRKAKRNVRLYEISGHVKKEDLLQSTQKFVDGITRIKWRWHDPDYDSFIKKYLFYFLYEKKILPKIEKRVGRRINSFPLKDVRLSVMPENFYDAARNHVNEILSYMGADIDKTIVLDQPFPACNPESCFPYFDDPYAIVVDRDPRDNYLFAKTKLLGRNHYMAVDSVEAYVEYYKALRNRTKTIDNRVLYIQFEDLVYDYDNTTKKIRSFLNLPDNPFPKSVFDPSLSIANTQVFKRFPEYKDDIDYIEKNIPEFLYDFDRYGNITIQGDMFFGKSPLHK